VILSPQPRSLRLGTRSGSVCRGSWHSAGLSVEGVDTTAVVLLVPSVVVPATSPYAYYACLGALVLLTSITPAAARWLTSRLLSAQYPSSQTTDPTKLDCRASTTPADSVSHIGATAWLAFIHPPARIDITASSLRVALPATTECTSPIVAIFQAAHSSPTASTRVGQRREAQASCVAR
jgi:hypothetical protein